MKKIIMITLLFCSIGLGFGPVVRATEEITMQETASTNGSEFEPGTFKFDLLVGEKGQVRRPQNSNLKDNIYSFKVTVGDSSIISFDDKGNWEALKAGSTWVSFGYPSGDSDQARRFFEETKDLPPGGEVTDDIVMYQITVTDPNQSTFNLAPLYRLYNPSNHEHLYTQSANERDTLVRIGWGSYEGIAWQIPDKGKPVYRLYNPILRDHHYTADLHEISVLTSRHNWKNEGVAWYSSGEKPVYRVFHPGLRTGSHHYTMNKHERDVLIQQHGWKDEGIAWYGH